MLFRFVDLNTRNSVAVAMWGSSWGGIHWSVQRFTWGRKGGSVILVLIWLTLCPVLSRLFKTPCGLNRHAID